MAAQSITVMESSVQFFDDDSNTAKRMKKEPGAVTGKSIVVLKESDVITRNEMVFMPNTIEMAQLKKPEKGQFKTNVQISSKMTEMDIKSVLVETFPFLAYRRFCCAAAVDNRTRLDFHGERRIWDGQFIKRKIKGNSALYIFTNEESVDHKDSKASEDSTLKHPYNQITVIENNDSEQIMKTETKPEVTTKLPLILTAYPTAHQTIHSKESGDHSDSKMTEQSTLKRSHDQITTRENVNSDQLMKKETGPEDITKPLLTHTAYLNSEKQAKLFVETSFSPKNILSQPSVVPEASMTSAASGAILEKREHLHPTKVQLLPQNVFVPVTAQQGIMTPVCRPSISANRDTRNAKDVVMVAAPSIPQAVPVGTIMVPSGIVAPGVVPRTIITTASDQQFLGNAVFHIADGRTAARHAGLPLVAQSVPHVIVSSTLTPQMNNLNISNAAATHSHKPVYLEKSAEKRNQSSQTEENIDSSECVHMVTAASQCDGDGSFPVDSSKKAATGQQHVAFRFPDQSKQYLDEEKCSGLSHSVERRAYVDIAKDKRRNEPAGTAVSDQEQSGSQDSGIETSDNPGEGNVHAEQIHLDASMATQKHEKKIDKLVEAEGTGSGLVLLSDVAALHRDQFDATKEPSSNEERDDIDPLITSTISIRSAVTEKKSIVQAICPTESSVRGGSAFVIILREHLPSDVVSGQAHFGNSATVPLRKVNEFNMAGRIPAASTPGKVTVKVHTSSGDYLGETSFEYFDEIKDTLQLVIRNDRLRALFFRLMAQDLENKSSETLSKETLIFPSFKITDTERHGETKNAFQQPGCFENQEPQKADSERDIYQIAEPFVYRNPRNLENETGYDSDDEASSTDSSEDGDDGFNAGGVDSNSSLKSCDTVIRKPEEINEIENRGLHRGLNIACKPCSCQFVEATAKTQHVAELFSPAGVKSEEFPHRRHRCDKEQSLGQMMFVAIKDTLETLPSNSQESAAFFGPWDPAAVPRFSRREMIDAARHSCDVAQDNREAPERPNNPENTETENVDRQLTLIEFDENSESDKTRRAHARRSNEMDDSPGADL